MKKFKLNDIKTKIAKLTKKKKPERPLNYKIFKAQKQLNLKKKRKVLEFKFKHNSEELKKFFLIGTVSFITILILGSFYLFLGPVFRIKLIEAIKRDSLTDIAIVYKSLENIRGKSIFSIQKKDLLTRIQSYQENIADISIKRKFPNTLYMEIDSYKPAFNIYIGEKSYFLLDNGSVVPTNQYNPELLNLGVVDNFKKNNFISYKKIYKEDIIRKIKKIIEQTKINIQAAIVPTYYEKERELHLQINNSTIITFSLDEDISVEEQIKKLAIIHKESNAVLSGENVYIDVRIKGKAYVCSYENEGTCRYNLSYLYPEVQRPIVPQATETETSLNTEIK